MRCSELILSAGKRDATVCQVRDFILNERGRRQLIHVLTKPNIASKGFYTNEDSPNDSKVSQHICPKGFWCKEGVRQLCLAGYFGDALGLTDSHCSGSCSAGYYCLSGSHSPHQFPCGNSTVYCPKGSKLPTPVDKGFFSASVNESIIADVYNEPNLNTTRQMQGKPILLYNTTVETLNSSTLSLSLQGFVQKDITVSME